MRKFFIFILLCNCSGEEAKQFIVEDTDGGTDGNTDTDSDSNGDSDDFDSDTTADTDSDPDTETDTNTETDTDADTDTETSTDTGTNTNTDTETNTETSTETESDTSTDIDTDTETTTISTDTDTDTDTDTGTGTDTDTNTETETESNLGEEWVFLPAGSFWMGSSSGNANELPVHQVTISSFWLYKTEVTVADYAKCVNSLGCTEPISYDSLHVYCNWDKIDHSDYPVNCLTWVQAAVFCDWLGARLPSESEWEYAARNAGTDTVYPWGIELPNCTNAIIATSIAMEDWGCEQESTWPVCSKTAGNTIQGLCDMSGNVFEFVQDNYNNTYEGAPIDGSAWESGSDRVRRGGDFTSPASYGVHRASFRSNVFIDTTSPNLGFRCAL